MDLFHSLASTFSGLFSGAPAPRPAPRPFSAVYKAMPMAFAGKDHLDMGNKVIMPPSALAKLTRSNVEYPMMFSMVNNGTGQKTHVGVMEFSAPEGIAYIPLSVMRSLRLLTEAPVTFTSIVLPRGTFVKIQPHQTTFIQLSNPKAVLEKSLRSFSCLTAGETFSIAYADTEYDIDVLEVRPDRFGAISLIDTDVQVEFVTPKDYVEPQLQPPISEPSPLPQRAIRYGNDDTSADSAAMTSTTTTASPLSSRPGGYRLNSTAPVQPSSSPSQMSTNVASALSPSSSAPRRTIVVQGQWRYTYEVDPATQRRRLVRRDPITPATLSSATPGHSLQ